MSRPKICHININKNIFSSFSGNFQKVQYNTKESNWNNMVAWRTVEKDICKKIYALINLNQNKINSLKLT